MSHVDASVLVVGPEPPVQRLLERASRRLRWSSQRRLRARQSER
jgi:hypothetical protein